MFDYRKLIFDSLDDAYENGYDMSKYLVNEVVTNLIDYDSELLFLPIDKCIEYIHDWQDEKIRIEEINKNNIIEEEINLE